MTQAAQLYHRHLAEAMHAVRHTTPAFIYEEQPWIEALADALAGTGCTSLDSLASGEVPHNFTLCLERGEALRAPSGETCDSTMSQQPFARWDLDLDRLLGVTPTWSRCPGNRVRPLLTSHFVGDAASGGCDASLGHPWLLRVHHYCEDPIGGGDGGSGSGARLTQVLQGAEVLSAAASRARQPSALRAPTWSHGTRRPFERTARLACQLELFVDTPRLCAHPLLGARALSVARLESTLQTLFGGGRGSGFAPTPWRGGGEGGEGDAAEAELGREATYGELSVEGMVQLLTGWPASHPLDDGATLLDVGSGAGKLLFAAALLTPARARGVEYVADRAALAAAALADAARDGLLAADEARRVEPIHADATAPGALDGATHLYMANLCFPDALNRAMVGALAAVASLRCVATLRPLPLDEEWPSDAAACRPTPVAERMMSMSWADSVGVTFYCCDENPTD